MNLTRSTTGMHDALQLKVLSPDEMDIWDALVCSSDQGTAFIRSDFLKALMGTSLAGLVPLVFEENGRCVGGILLRQVKQGGFRAFRSPPHTFTKYGGPLLLRLTAKDIRHLEKLNAGVLSGIDEYVSAQGAQFTSVVQHWQAPDVRPLLQRGWSPRIHYTYLLPTDSREAMWSRLDQKLRNIIRKAEKSGMTVEPDSDGRTFYTLWQATMKRAGNQIPISLEAFQRVMDTLSKRDAGRIYIARLPSGEAQAGVVVLWDERRAYYWLGASTDRQEDGASSLALWTAILEARERVPEIDLVGANTPSVSFFKAQFNPILQPYYELRKRSALGAVAELVYFRSPRVKTLLKGIAN